MEIIDYNGYEIIETYDEDQQLWIVDDFSETGIPFNILKDAKSYIDSMKRVYTKINEQCIDEGIHILTLIKNNPFLLKQFYDLPVGLIFKIEDKRIWTYYKCRCGEEYWSDFPYMQATCLVCKNRIIREDLKQNHD